MPDDDKTGWSVVPIAERHIEGFRRAVGVVAREGRYIAFIDAPPPEQARAFVLSNIEKGNPQFVGLVNGEVVGWCDIVRSNRATHAHCGTLGMGIVPAHRGKGVGLALITAALDMAWAAGFVRVDLTVYAENDRALALYKKMGFVVEGRATDAACLNGRLLDVIQMGLVNATTRTAFLAERNAT
ncbi:GNAT family N-acetyltransferase [Salmonella enterica subsp. enterica]|nr:GNAT family N-acetyltransferase [Salmonella enterica subsp. enterica serovar Enteritidis]